MATLDTTLKVGALVRNIYAVSNDPLHPQTSVQLKAYVEDFHKTAGSRFKVERIFSSECVTCHGDRAKGKSGEGLYRAVCSLCHKNGGSAFEIDEAYLKTSSAGSLRRHIATGTKSMPSFARAHGGPLSDRQIKSLVVYLMSRLSQN